MARVYRFALFAFLTAAVACGDDDGPTDGGPDGSLDGSIGTPGVLVSPTTGLETSERGDSAMFQIVLRAQPNADVTIPLSSSDETEGTVSTTSVVFTSDNWSAPQIVTVVGVDDDEADGNVAFVVSVSPATSADADYDGLDGDDVAITNIDDETAGFTVTPTVGLETTELGGTGDFTVVLNAMPTADVTIEMSSDDEGEGSVSPTALTFTPENWNAPQIATVTGVDDDEADGPQTFTIVLAPAASPDPAYDGLDPDDVEVVNLDDETAGIRVEPTDGLTTTEMGGEASFTIALTTLPSADVIVDLSSSDEGEGAVSPATVTFTPDNWNAPQVVTVTGVDDFVADGNQVYQIITAPAVSGDSDYDELDANDVTLTNTDDETAGISVDPTADLYTTEGGGEASFTVVLNSRPTADVTIPVTSSDDSEGTVSVTSLVFTTDNWNAPQTLTVRGVDDDVADGDQPYSIVLGAATSADPSYDGMDAVDPSIINTDDETPGITVGTIDGDTGEDGTSASFTVVLNSQPTSEVTLDLRSSDASEGAVDPTTLTFTSDNWNAPQNVTVEGIDDDVADGNQPYLVITAPASSSDASYDGRDAVDVPVVNVDDDSAGITVSPTSGLRTSEGGGTAGFTIVLNSQPTAAVSFGLMSSNAREGNVSPSSVTFTTDNWDAPRAFTVTGIDDPVADGDQPYRIITGAAVSSDPSYDGRDPANVELVNVDNDSAGITVSPTSGVQTTESGGSDFFEVVLNSRPASDVTIGLSSEDPSEGTVSPSSVTFTSSNWNAPRVVTVSGVDDAVADGNQLWRVITAAAASSDPDYDGLDASNVEVTNVDDDSPGVIVALADGVSDEGGDTAAVRLVLTSQPTADVVIVPRSLDTSEGVPDVGQITFTSDNWNAPQTFTLTGQNDDVADGNQPYLIRFRASSTDSEYDRIPMPSLIAVNFDDDSAGVIVTVEDGTSGEDGNTGLVDFVLQSEPTADVTVDIRSTDNGEGVPRVTSLTFTPTNWSAPQAVLVDGINDDQADGDQRYRLAWSVSTVDREYSPLTGRSTELTNVDDDSPGVQVTILDSSSGEDGDVAMLEVVLSSQPFSDVRIDFTTDDPSEGAMHTAEQSITFTPTNWSSTRIVRVLGVDDFVADGNQQYAVDWSATSSDAGYDPLSGTAGPLTNVDNDSPGITTLRTDQYSNENGVDLAAFTVVLESEPTMPVTISFASTDPTEANDPPPVVFTASNWSSPATVYIQGVDDFVADGNQRYMINYVASSGDAGYDGMAGRVRVFRNIDDDSPGVSVTVEDPTTGEAGDQGALSVVLTSEPTASVTVSFVSDRPDEGRPAVGSITFDATNWFVPQTVHVDGVNDFVADGDQRFEIDWTVTSADAGYSPLTGTTTQLTNLDDDTPGIQVTVLRPWSREDGTLARFRMVLSSQPVAPVTLDLSISDPTEGLILGTTSIVVTEGTWGQVRVVRVRGLDDVVVDGDVPYTVTITPSSSDADYDSLTPPVVSLTNLDDDSPGVVVTPIDTETDEDRDPGSFSVVLTTPPASDVVINVASADLTEGEVTSGSTLTFNATNWSTPQIVSVEGRNDTVADGDVPFTVVTSATTSSDPSYDGLLVDDVDFLNVDDDFPGLIVQILSDTSTEDGSGDAQVRVRLRTAPAFDVTVPISVSDATEGSASPTSLVFTTAPGDWRTWQTVTISGVDDPFPDGDTLYLLTVGPSNSIDVAYRRHEKDVLLTNLDDDNPGPIE